MPVRVNPFANLNSGRFQKNDSFQFGQRSNVSTFSNPFAKLETNPSEFGATNPFAKVSSNKENTPQNRQVHNHVTFKHTSKPKPTFIHRENAIVGAARANSSTPEAKTSNELLASVVGYFLSSPLTEGPAGQLDAAFDEEARYAELNCSVMKPLAEVYLKDIPVNDSFKSLYK